MNIFILIELSFVKGETSSTSSTSGNNTTKLQRTPYVHVVEDLEADFEDTIDDLTTAEVDPLFIEDAAVTISAESDEEPVVLYKLSNSASELYFGEF